MTKQTHPAASMRRCLAIIGVIGMMLFGASAAQAGMIREAPFTEPYSGDFNVCGTDIHVEGVFSATVTWREGKNKVASTFFLHETSSHFDTATDPLTGEVLWTTESKGLRQDLTATHVEGNVFLFTGIEAAGQTYVIRDPSGRVVLRERGVIRTTILADTRGDAIPGAEQLEVLSVDISGPHFFDEATFCAAMEPVLP